MTDFVRGKVSLSKKLEDEENKNQESLVSTKRIQPKRKSEQISNGKGKGKSGSSDKKHKKDGEEDEDLFSSAYNSLKNIKKKKEVSRIQHLNPQQLKDFMEDPSTEFTEKEEIDAKKMLPFLKKNIPSEARRLFKKDLYSGITVLASFESVSEMDITVGLPFGLKGYIKFNEVSDQFTQWIKEVVEQEERKSQGRGKEISSFRRLKVISDQLRKMFYKGQLLKCSVVGLTPNKNAEGLHCTLRPEIINNDQQFDNFCDGMTIQGVIESKEDKGYLISFGKEKDFKGFLEYSETAYYYPGQTSEDPNTLYIGQPLELYIREINKETKTLQLSVSHSLVSRALCKSSEFVTMDSIKAGMLVETKILKVLPNGVHLGFLDFFSGDIHTMHLEKSLETYRENQNLKARIIFVDQTHKKIGLSCLGHILGFKPYPFGLTKPGDVFQSSHVSLDRVEPLEMFFQLPLKSEQKIEMAKLRGYMHLTEAEIKADTLTSIYKVKESTSFDKPVRVKSLNLLEGCALLTSQSRSLSQKYFSYYDLSAGQIVQGQVTIVRDDSLEVQLAIGIVGVVPKNNMAELMISDPKKMFKEGQQVKCRVLSVDPENRRLSLTLKKSIIASNYPLLLTMDQVETGILSHGVITKVTDHQVFVSFYNQVFGIIKAKELSKTKLDSVKRNFKIGQVVLCKVLAKNHPALELSLIISDEDITVFNNLLAIRKEKEEKALQFELEKQKQFENLINNNNKNNKNNKMDVDEEESEEEESESENNEEDEDEEEEESDE
ncbi:hypothetical protein DLAC_03350 [Tieghemostelium lacteum]|uniref:S1 motif domain-containing protein n=1 Tax=Tieghemostelium lacteum TaxID=361077 RepID=A0A152A1R3_TIELA|nr:hypothetical protein DLAC_03350 [Tieghemostelium lacteum]|eukprot:KYR00193.1 hypothetical protein DLAC_03350 [Tieghemostelium lacteum]